MKRTVLLFLLLPLLLVAPCSAFLAPYLDGRGVLFSGFGFLSFPVSVVVPFFVACCVAVVLGARHLVRVVFLFVGAMVVQYGLLFGAVPAPALSLSMGLAHRFRPDADELKRTANDLLRKARDGTLTVRATPGQTHPPTPESAILADDSELPTSLRGRFWQVEVHTEWQGGLVILRVDGLNEIACGGDSLFINNWQYRVAPGVIAYRRVR